MVVGDLDGCAVYLDDVVIYSGTRDDHMLHIHSLFDCLTTARLTVNLTMCELACSTVTFLGHVVGQGQVWPVQAAWNYSIIKKNQKSYSPNDRTYHKSKTITEFFNQFICYLLSTHGMFSTRSIWCCRNKCTTVRVKHYTPPSSAGHISCHAVLPGQAGHF